MSPLFLLLEDVSTLSMPLGYLLSGGRPDTILFLIYLLYCLFSSISIFIPSPIGEWLKLSFFHLTMMERSYRKTGCVWLYPIFLLTFWWETQKNASYQWTLLRAMMVALVGQISFQYLYHWICVVCLYLYHVKFILLEDEYMTRMIYFLYHLHQGTLAVIEQYPDYSTGWVEQWFRYCCYFSFVFQTAHHLSSDPKRLRSVLTGMTAIVLTPLSYYQIISQVQQTNQIYFDNFQIEMILFYLAYATMDLLFGKFFYPQYMPLLDGWFHHLATIFFGIYYLFSENRVLFCMCMVIETSTIFLSLFRIFYDVAFILWLRDRYFTTIFIIFRLLFPTGIMIFFRSLLVDPLAIVIYLVNMVLNGYWLFLLQQKKENKRR